MTQRQRYFAYLMGGYGLSLNALTAFLVPLRAVDLGVPLAVIGLLVGVRSVAETLLSVPLGRWMDRAGARTGFLAGSLGTAVLGVGFFLAEDVAVLFLLQLLIGATRPLGWVGGQSYVSGMSSGADRVRDTGRLSFVANLFQIVTPLLAGLVVEGRSAQFGFLLMCGHGLFFVLVGLQVPRDEGRRTAGGKKTKGEGGSGNVGDVARRPRTRELFAIPAIRSAMFLTFARLWLTSAWTSFFPLLLITNGLSAAVAGSAVSVMSALSTVLALTAGPLSKRIRPAFLTALALGAGALGLAIGPLFLSVPWIYASALLMGIGQGLSLPLLIVIVSDAVPEDRRGQALSLRNSVNQGASMVSPTLIAPLMAAFGALVAFPVIGGIAAFALLLSVASTRRADAAQLHGRSGSGGAA
jgi:MFS transporter, DHA1 family, inner membrane transport protein